LFDAVGHQLPQRGVVADVRLAGQHLAALGLHQADGLREILRGGRRVGEGVGRRRADIERDDVGAFPGEPHRVRPPLRSGGAGNERYPSLQ